mmetsp:Transcript_142793/g.397765  ORF Transcript_142793/g.397765 Transcript_142793/m.397765 type:complete len:291 (+) Transcript_142793:1877-2749(+)
MPRGTSSPRSLLIFAEKEAMKMAIGAISVTSRPSVSPLFIKPTNTCQATARPARSPKPSATSPISSIRSHAAFCARLANAKRSPLVEVSASCADSTRLTKLPNLKRSCTKLIIPFEMEASFSSSGNSRTRFSGLMRSSAPKYLCKQLASSADMSNPSIRKPAMNSSSEITPSLFSSRRSKTEISTTFNSRSEKPMLRTFRSALASFPRPPTNCSRLMRPALAMSPDVPGTASMNARSRVSSSGCSPKSWSRLSKVIACCISARPMDALPGPARESKRRPMPSSSPSLSPM